MVPPLLPALLPLLSLPPLLPFRHPWGWGAGVWSLVMLLTASAEPVGSGDPEGGPVGLHRPLALFQAALPAPFEGQAA